jgi:hypothetical protein
MCTLCRRNLLAGELYRRWEPAGREGERPVCMLCEPHAAKAGWVRAAGEAARESAAGLGGTVRLVA